MPYPDSHSTTQQRFSRDIRFLRNGWIAIETMIALALLLILLTSVIALETSISTFNNRMHAHRRCLSAAQANLDSMSANGHTMDKADVERLWPGVETKVRISDGQGDWEGLTLVNVTASTKVRKSTVSANTAP